MVNKLNKLVQSTSILQNHIAVIKRHFVIQSSINISHTKCTNNDGA